MPAPVIDAVALANEAHQGAIVARLADLLGAGASSGGGSLAGRHIGLLGLASRFGGIARMRAAVRA